MDRFEFDNPEEQREYDLMRNEWTVLDFLRYNHWAGITSVDEMLELTGNYVILKELLSIMHTYGERVRRH